MIMMIVYSFFFFVLQMYVCWAIVVSELIRAMRIIDGDKTIRYSPQDLIDFSDKEKRRTEQKSGPESDKRNGIRS